MAKIPKSLKRYFWDTDISKIDSIKHQAYIIRRLLEYGDTQAIHWLKKTFPNKKIKQIASKSRQVGPKTKNFFQLILK